MKIYLGEQAVGLGSYVEVGNGENLDDELFIQDDLIDSLTEKLKKKGAGLILPELSNPASADKIIEGYQAVDGEGKLITGTSKAVETEDATATADKILKGEIAYVKGEKITGMSTAVETEDATATEADIVSGKTAYVNGKKVTGAYSGTEINGIIERYKVYAGESISAGDFVSYLNGTPEIGSSILVANSNSNGSTFSAVALTDNKVFIAFSGSQTELYGKVCTIDGKTITAGATKTINGSYGSAMGLSVTKLTDTKVFIAHSANTAYDVCGTVCTISGSTITSGSKITIYTNSSYQVGMNVNVCTLSENSVFITFPYSNRTLYAAVCTISGTTITAGTIAQIASTTNSGWYGKIVPLSSNKVFIAYTQETTTLNSTYSLQCAVCTINGTKITKNTDTQLNTEIRMYQTRDIVLLNSNKVFIVSSNNPSDSTCYGIVCGVNSDNTVTYGDLIQLNTSKCDYINAVLLSGNRIFIAYKDATTDDVYYTVCIVDGNSFAVGEHKILDESYPCYITIDATLVAEDKVFVGYGYDEDYCYLRGIIISLASGLTSYTSGIFGIAKESGTGGDTIEVYVPN